MQDHDVKSLSARMEALVSGIFQRFEDQNDVATQRHQENVARLVTIESEVRRTNGRVTRTEEQILTLFARLKELFNSRRDDDQEIRRADLRWLILAFVAGASVLAWILKLMGKL